MFKHLKRLLKNAWDLKTRSVGFWLVLTLLGIICYGLMLYFGVIDWFYKSPYNGEKVGP